MGEMEVPWECFGFTNPSILHALPYLLSLVTTTAPPPPGKVENEHSEEVLVLQTSGQTTAPLGIQALT